MLAAQQLHKTDDVSSIFNFSNKKKHIEHINIVMQLLYKNYANNIFSFIRPIRRWSSCIIEASNLPWELAKT
jgi:hypothetical protein